MFATQLVPEPGIEPGAFRYIRLLQDWLDDLDPPRDQNDASDSYVDSLIVKSVVDCLKKEAAGQIGAGTRESILLDLD